MNKEKEKNNELKINNDLNKVNILISILKYLEIILLIYFGVYYLFRKWEDWILGYRILMILIVFFGIIFINIINNGINALLLGYENIIKYIFMKPNENNNVKKIQKRRITNNKKSKTKNDKKIDVENKTNISSKINNYEMQLINNTNKKSGFKQ